MSSPLGKLLLKMMQQNISKGTDIYTSQMTKSMRIIYAKL